MTDPRRVRRALRRALRLTQDRNFEGYQDVIRVAEVSEGEFVLCFTEYRDCARISASAPFKFRPVFTK